MPKKKKAGLNKICYTFYNVNVKNYCNEAKINKSAKVQKSKAKRN